MEQTLKSYVEQSQHGTCDHHNSSYSIYFLRRILPKLKPLCTGNGKYIMVCTNYNRFHVSLLVLSNTQVRSEVSLFARNRPMNEICCAEKEEYYRAVLCSCKSIQTYFYAERFQGKNKEVILKRAQCLWLYGFSTQEKLKFEP